MELDVPDYDWTIIKELPEQDRKKKQEKRREAEETIRKTALDLQAFYRLRKKLDVEHEHLGQAQPVFENTERSRKRSPPDYASYGTAMHNVFYPLLQLLNELSNYPRIERISGLEEFRNRVRVVEGITANASDFKDQIEEVSSLMQKIFNTGSGVLRDVGREINNNIESSKGVIVEKRKDLRILYQDILARAVHDPQGRQAA